MYIVGQTIGSLESIFDIKDDLIKKRWTKE